MQTVIAIEGLDTLNFLPAFTTDVEKALVQALNRTADHFRTSADRRIRDQVRFPASYLRPSAGRLTVSSRASASNFVARVTGRDAATSLTRFLAQRGAAPGRRPKDGALKVQVKAGGSRATIQRAFLIKLRNDNVGFAVRTDGSAPKGAYKPKEIGKGLWLLYGPSVDQVLSAATDGDGVVTELTPETLDFLEREFTRNLKRFGM